MFFNSRRFSVWLVSFLAVSVIYFIYNRVSRTPTITLTSSKQSVNMIPDVCDANRNVGKVGNVGVETVRNVRYTRLNSEKQVEGEFGFEELLHQDGNDWEIKRPYYTMYRKGFKCTISGERARVTVETSGGRVTPKQGLLTGNVAIKIWPKSGGGMEEAVIYLDDILFIGDKSLFTTPGQVEVVSKDIRMLGRGMELIYDSDAERLDLMKIGRLQNLRIKRWSRGTVFGAGQPGQEAKNGENAGKEKKPGQQYQCRLNKNVVIETLRERLLAEVVSINNIFMASGAGEVSGKGALPAQQEKDEISRVVGRGDSNLSDVESEGDVAISCQGELVITPMDATRNQEQETLEAGCEKLTSEEAKGKTTFCGGRIDYDVATGEAVAKGTSQIAFEVNDANRNNPVAVAISSRRQTRYEPASQKVYFEGDCRCTISQAEGIATRQYFVLADSLEVDLIQKDGVRAGTSLDIGRLIAQGGDVRLASTKKLGDKILTGIELKCAGMDYNTTNRDFYAAGPGLIKVDNSQTNEPQKGLAKFSLQRKCYAFVRNFSLLKFDGGSNHLVADSNGGSLLVDYLPLAEGKNEDKVAVTASHVEADILETAGGRMELGALTATGAVTYEDKDVQINGGEFVYDANGVAIRGDRAQPCYFNGAIVDMATYDPKSGRWNAKVKGPGAIR